MCSFHFISVQFKQSNPNRRTLDEILGAKIGGPNGSRLSEPGHTPIDYFKFKSLILQMLQYDPTKRITPWKALEHVFLKRPADQANTSDNSGVGVGGGGNVTTLIAPTPISATSSSSSDVYVNSNHNHHHHHLHSLNQDLTSTASGSLAAPDASSFNFLKRGAKSAKIDGKLELRV